MNQNGYLWPFAGFWFATVGSGLIGVTVYSITPGAPAAAQATWAPDCGIAFDRSRPNLLVFVHPQCPCSRATLAELERAIAASDERAAITIVLIQPEGMAEGWERTGVWRAANAISGAKVLTDHGGALTKRFGAATSGQVLLYESSGRLVFQGGITGSRGHEGDNAGRAAVICSINGAGKAAPSTPVFGCKLSCDLRKTTAMSSDN